MNRPLRSVVMAAVLDAWSVLQPVECAGCGAPDRAICDQCRGAIVANPRLRTIDGLDLPVLAAATYDGVIRRLILAGKDHGRTDAMRALSPLLLAVVREAVPAGCAPVELAWVPSTRAAVRRRGFDPMLSVIRAAGLRGSRVIAAAGRGQQKAMDRAQRVSSAPRRWRPVGVLEGRRFVVVDDVVTTGATLRAATSAIRLGGGDVLAVCCLGTVDLRRTARDTDADGH